MRDSSTVRMGTAAFLNQAWTGGSEPGGWLQEWAKEQAQ